MSDRQQQQSPQDGFTAGVRDSLRILFVVYGVATVLGLAYYATKPTFWEGFRAMVGI